MTTEANEIVGKVHDPKFRMPVILDQYEEQLWLAKDLSSTDRLTLCNPYPDEKMKSYRVSTVVNTAATKGVANNTPELMTPINSN